MNILLMASPISSPKHFRGPTNVQGPYWAQLALIWPKKINWAQIA